MSVINKLGETLLQAKADYSLECVKNWMYI